MFSANDYLAFAISLFIPCWMLPLFLATEEEKKTPYLQRYSVKANLWILIVSYLGSHFFTHYFYTVLGMKYSGPLAEGIHVNGVPLSMYFMAHVYFLSYHILLSSLQRILRGVLAGCHVVVVFVTMGLFFTTFAIFTAFAETWAISSFPYYTYPNFLLMLTYGSGFYGIFFVVSFPMFCRIDPHPRRQTPLFQVIIEAFGSVMVIMLLADIWRLCIGTIFNHTGHPGVPYAQKGSLII